MALQSKLSDIESSVRRAYNGLHEYLEPANLSQPSPHRQSLRWTLPVLWCSLVLVSYSCGLHSVLSGVPVYADISPSSDAAIVVALKPEGPVHGKDPHGDDPHDEHSDGGLPANEAQGEQYPDRDVRGNPKS